MTKNDKAITRLGSLGIVAKSDNGVVYVVIGDVELELSEFEVNFQVEEYETIKKLKV